MARLVLPGKSSSLARTGLLGLTSYSRVRATCGVSSVGNYSNCSSRYKCFPASQVISRSNFYRPNSSLFKAKQGSRRLICSIATETLSKNIEEFEMDTPKEIFLKDYKMPDYYFDTVDLNFSLGEEKTIVSSRITVTPRVEGGFSTNPTLISGFS